MSEFVLPDEPPATTPLGHDDYSTWLAEYLRSIWQANWRRAVRAVIHPDAQFRCDEGVLVGRDAVESRMERLRRMHRGAMFSITDIGSRPNGAAARWELNCRSVARRPGTNRRGSTLVVLSDRMIIEAWEFWEVYSSTLTVLANRSTSQ
jgi:hypothetical protein